MLPSRYTIDDIVGHDSTKQRAFLHEVAGHKDQAVLRVDDRATWSGPFRRCAIHAALPNDAAITEPPSNRKI